MKVPFTFTLNSMLYGKFYNWSRRSVLKTVIAAALLAIGIPLQQSTNGTQFDWKIFVAFMLGLSFLSFVAIVSSSILFMREIKRHGQENISITFEEDSVTITDVVGPVQKEWSWIKEFKNTNDALFLRTRDGLFSHIYFYVRKDQYPQFDQLAALISKNFKTRKD